MKFCTKFIRCIVLAVVFANAAIAVPFQGNPKNANVQIREISPGLVIESYHPESSFETFGIDGQDHPLSNVEGFDVEQASIAFVQSHLGVDPDTVEFSSSALSDVTHHAYMRQQINGVPIANAVANVAFSKENNRVVSFGSSFVKPTYIPSTTPSVSVQDAITKAEGLLSGKYNEHPATLEFVAKKDNSLALTHVVQIQNDDTDTWFEAFVDAHNGEVIHLVDFVAQAAYRVVPITKESIAEGAELVTNPQLRAASPQGWHSDGTNATTDTTGNNVYAVKNQVPTKQSAGGLVFDYTQIPSQDPAVQVNADAATTNAFYVSNVVHDIAYLYGFTEAKYNFQNNNFGNGGKGNDRVIVSVQDLSGFNNANFATPSDGQSGRMRMYLFTLTDPRRDGALENSIVVHEYTHGISNRLTGGGTARCLQISESRGLGEGWSDAFAEWTEQKNATIVDYVLGQYVINNPEGIRNYPYSTNSSTNPLRYSSLNTKGEVHAVGEVWANMLHNVYAALVSARGYSSTARTDASGTSGNVVFLHLFIDGMSLQPCNPTFIQARDAIIQADVNRYQGQNRCTLWKAFASRGLGIKAANYKDDSTVPNGC